MSKLAKLQKTQNFESSSKPKIPRLSHAERIVIEVRYCEDDWSMRNIAKALTRYVSVVSREVNKKPRKDMGRYRASVAQKLKRGINQKPRGRARHYTTLRRGMSLNSISCKKITARISKGDSCCNFFA